MKAGDEASCAGQPQRPLAAAATRAPGRRVSQLQPRSMSGSPGGPSLGGRGGQPRLGGDGAGLHRPPPSRAALPRPRRRPPPSSRRRARGRRRRPSLGYTKKGSPAGLVGLLISPDSAS
ncbi:unnamed protein product [Prorocentrum cordatum]|uniref:Uncharacterized protein n=2 Tax=Prorocentrum cordatum TaxID=2364126 RepID=A0ABN9XSU5_9DINO|nr:unnamed protein product [Polarella glacialis]